MRAGGWSGRRLSSGCESSLRSGAISWWLVSTRRWNIWKHFGFWPKTLPTSVPFRHSSVSRRPSSTSIFPRFRFRGDVWAIPEGTPVFAGEPLLRVSASLPEAQVVETALLSTVLFQTMIASKASRVVHAARGRAVIEFGGRRAHGTGAAALGARASYVAGCSGTSNLEAGARFGIPVSGTMAHSWVMSHSSEAEAFRRYIDCYGAQSVLLLDTYDTLNAARLIVDGRLHPAAVRLDSGDLESVSVAVRRILDGGAHQQTRILASGDLDEHRIAGLVASGAPIDGFGVGTALSTSTDAPSLPGVYKLVEVDRGGTAVPVAKRSPEKNTQPGVKQVWRVLRGDLAEQDLVTLSDEGAADGAGPLLECVMRDGRRLTAPSSLPGLQQSCRNLVGQLPESVRALCDPARYPVRLSQSLQALGTRVTGQES